MVRSTPEKESAGSGGYVQHTTSAIVSAITTIKLRLERPLTQSLHVQVCDLS
jgi:hypothetical protein